MRFVVLFLLLVCARSFGGWTNSTMEMLYMEDLGFGSQGWTALYGQSAGATDFPEGIWNRRSPVGEQYTSVDIDFGNTWPAGTYRVWVYGYMFDAACPMRLDLGSGSATTTMLPGLRMTSFTIAPSTSFSSAEMFLTNGLYPTAKHDMRIANVLLTSNTNLINVPFLSKPSFQWLNYTQPTTTNTDYVVGNLQRNSSFELGWAYGLCSETENEDGFTPWIQNVVTDSYSQHGAYSIQIPQYETVHLPFFRVRCDNEVKAHTISVWAKYEGSAAATLQLYLLSTADTVSGVDTPFNYSPAHSWGLSTSFARKSVTVDLSDAPGREYYIYLKHNQDCIVYVDAVQVEEGTAPTDYAPSSGVEHWFTSGNTGAVHDASSPAMVYCDAYNNGAETNTTIRWVVYTPWSDVLESGTTNVTLTANDLTRTTIAITNTQRGWQRIVSRLDCTPGVWNEHGITRIDTGAVTPSASGRLGTHADYNTEYLDHNLFWGLYGPVRSLSPARTMRWDSTDPVIAVEKTEGVWNFDHLHWNIQQATNSGYSLIISLNTGSKTSGTPDHGYSGTTVVYPKYQRYISNCVYQVATYYPDVWDQFIFEGWNEAGGEQATEERSAIPAMTALELSNITKSEIAGISNAVVKANADNGTSLPQPYYIGPCLGAQEEDFLDDLFGYLTAGEIAYIDGVAKHIYSTSALEAVGEDYESRVVDIYNYVKGTLGKDLWQTEAGAYAQGGYRSVKGFDSRESYWTWPYFQFIQDYRPQTESLLRNVFRVLGVGWDHFNYYDSRLVGKNYSWADPPTQTTSYEIDSTLRPQAAALYHWSRQIGTGVSGGGGTNANGLEAYLFDGDEMDFVAAWALDRNKAYTVTLGDPEDIVALNMYGSLLSSNVADVLVTRRPVIFATASLGTNTLWSRYSGASVSETADTTAPKVTIDLSPFGAMNSTNTPHLMFKWVHQDDQWFNANTYTASEVRNNATNVVSRYKINGYNDWSAYGQQTYFEVAAAELTGTTNYLQVQAMDALGNESDVFDGPLFSVDTETPAEPDPPDPPWPGPSGSGINVNADNLYVR